YNTAFVLPSHTAEAERSLSEVFQLLSRDSSLISPLLLTFLARTSVRATLILFCSLLSSEAAVAGLAPGDYSFYVTHQGLRRSYLLHVPPQASDARALPLVL